MIEKSVLVIGGGIAGIQASIDLGNMGFKVYLVEKSPSIGGRMAQLDKTFPTNDCSICILALKMIECSQHKNITLSTYSEVTGVKGKAGSFRVRVLKKARYVSEEKCTGCGDCAAKCPTKTDDEFDMGLRKRKSIYLPFLQAVPRVYTIDRDHCLYLNKGKCGICEKVCEARAIDFEQKDEYTVLKVQAIILATGFRPCDVTSLEEYGYGRLENVVTALEYERMISASGPTGGEIQRRSDGKVPVKLAFIQCIGSRDERAKRYCSAVCCMHATKEAMLSNEHYPGTESFIFYTDLRAVGKRFQEYMLRAKNECHVRYVRSRPGRVTEEEDTQNPIIWYEETTSREIKQMEVDLLVLCQALVPSESNEVIADLLGTRLDDNGFIETPNRLTCPVDTSVPGVFACGYCQSPQDIPDSVVQASAAAARAAELLEERRT